MSHKVGQRGIERHAKFLWYGVYCLVKPDWWGLRSEFEER